MNSTTAIGIAASVFTATSLIPQLVKIMKERQAQDVSLAMLGILFTGLALWVWYGCLRKDWIIVAANSFSLLLNVWIVVLSVKYKEKNE
jgi:MtN3 and saliva related transmembrane protein